MTPIKRRLTYVFKGTMLRLYISWENRRHSITLSTGYHVDKTDNKGNLKWDGRRCKPKTSHGKDKIPSTVINKVLENLEDDIEKAFYSFEIADSIPTASELKLKIRQPVSSSKTKDFATAFNEFIIEEGRNNQWADHTIRSSRPILNLVLKFKPSITFSSINKDFFNEFVAYQKEHKLSDKHYKNNKSGYSNSVIKKNCRIFNWFLKWAKAQGYLTIDTLDSFKANVKTITKPVIFLTWEELMALFNYQFEPRSEYDKARDFFCFCCFTSLRYSDAAALKPQQIVNDKIHLSSIKTDKSLIIDLNKYSKAILDKYDGCFKTALPFFTNHRLNVILKEIGRIVGINTPIHYNQYYGNDKIEINEPKYQLLSSHCGRRTFICNALSMGISTTTVMKWTGHSEYSSMKPYIDVADTMREKAMQIFDKN